MMFSWWWFFFRLISERENPEESYSLEMSVCEIYNNEVRDLLAGKNASRVSKMDWLRCVVEIMYY